MTMFWFGCAALVLCAAARGAQEQPWWKTATLYQVYPRSFKDSDGDGVGDLKGTIESIGYFKELGVDAIWLSPVYKSPMKDGGYDISNYIEVDPIFGTMDDFTALVTKLKEIGIKLLMDFDPNHTSDQHPWFQSSLNTSDPHHSDYQDFYIWRDLKGWHNEKTPIPPNNWMSVFESSAWQWKEERQQFYLHQCRDMQPDLNFRNPNVLANMTATLAFWLDKGIDGFRFGALKHTFENASFPDEPAVPGTRGSTYKQLNHIYSQNQPETFELVKYWAEFIYSRNLADGKKRAIFLEVYDPTDVVMKYYGAGNVSFQVPFNSLLLYLTQSSRANDFKSAIDTWMTLMPGGSVPNWVIGNHDYPRVSDRLGPERVDALNMMTGVLPGVMVVYNGEEIGMRNTFIRSGQDQDKSVFARDRARSPMQWDDTLSAGFSRNPNTWLPVNPNYWWLNVAAQKTAETSHLKVFQAMTQVRKDPVLQRGDLTVLTPDNDTLLIIRSLNESYFFLVINLGSEVISYNSQNLFTPNKLDGTDMTVVVGSVNSGYKAGEAMDRKSPSLRLRPQSAVLLRVGGGSVPSSALSMFLTCGFLLLLTMVLAVVLPFYYHMR